MTAVDRAVQRLVLPRGTTRCWSALHPTETVEYLDDGEEIYCPRCRQIDQARAVSQADGHADGHGSIRCEKHPHVPVFVDAVSGVTC